MNNNSTSLLIILILIFLHLKIAKAQTSETEIKIEQYTPTTGVRGAFLASMIHPGFQVGVERPYKFTQIDKHKLRKSNTFYKERYLSQSLGMYHHNNFHTNYFLQSEWILRKQKSKGFYFESSFGLGVSKTFVHGATYSVSDDGLIEKVPLSGNWYALASIGGGIGYNANLKKQKPYAVYLKHHWLLLFPYNAFITPRPTIAFGINYNLSNFWEAKPKSSSIIQQSRKLRKSQN